jgi:hypothetical protein
MYLKPAEAHPAAALAFMAVVARIERPVGLALNLALLLIGIAGLARPAIRWRLPLPALLGVAATLTGSVVQALAEHSDNGRFAVPFLPLIVVAVMLVLPTGLVRRPPASGAPAPPGETRVTPKNARSY